MGGDCSLSQGQWGTVSCYSWYCGCGVIVIAVFEFEFDYGVFVVMCDYLFVLFCFGVCDLLYVFCFIGAIPYHMKSTLECHTVHEESVRLNKLM